MNTHKAAKKKFQRYRQYLTFKNKIKNNFYSYIIIRNNRFVYTKLEVH